MSDLESIRKFEYRPFRMKTGFEVDFDSGGKTLHGLCRDVSDSGIRAEFDGSAVIGSSGLLILCHPTGVLRVEAQVAYVEKFQVGLVFLFKTQWESEMTIEFVTTIADHETLSQVVQFP
jgi:PilZ domain